MSPRKPKPKHSKADKPPTIADAIDAVTEGLSYLETALDDLREILLGVTIEETTEHDHENLLGDTDDDQSKQSSEKTRRRRDRTRGKR